MSQNENSKPSAAQTVLVEVADALKASPSVVRERLVAALTERELVKRVDMLDKGLAKVKELKRDRVKEGEGKACQVGGRFGEGFRWRRFR